MNIGSEDDLNNKFSSVLPKKDRRRRYFLYFLFLSFYLTQYYKITKINNYFYQLIEKINGDP